MITSSKFLAQNTSWNNLYYCTWVKNPTFTMIFFPKFVFLRFFERKLEKKVYDLPISGWVEVNPVNFLMFSLIFWPPKLNRSTRYTFFFEIKKLRQNTKTWLKTAKKNGIFQHFLDVSRLGSIDWILFSLLEPLGTIFWLLEY